MKYPLILFILSLVFSSLYATTDIEKVFQNQHLKIIFQPEDAWYMDSPEEFPRDIRAIDSTFRELSHYLSQLKQANSVHYDSLTIVLQPREIYDDSLKPLINKWGNRIVFMSLDLTDVKACVNETLNLRAIPRDQWQSPFQWIKKENILLRRIAIEELGEIDFARYPSMKNRAIVALQTELKKKDSLFDIIQTVLAKIR
ncbi:hypothetical protein JXJ21_10595 [candidate division KSB1 bacterium]|nr:hypothetical protein [candidate division KSB1 bacterium]